MQTRLKFGIVKPKVFTSSHTAPLSSFDESEPTSVKAVLADPRWKAAMQAKYDALLDNQTWKLVPFSSNMSIVRCKWVFRIKYKPDGLVLKYKACLVAKGFHQVPGFIYLIRLVR